MRLLLLLVIAGFSLVEGKPSDNPEASASHAKGKTVGVEMEESLDHTEGKARNISAKENTVQVEETEEERRKKRPKPSKAPRGGRPGCEFLISGQARPFDT